MTFFVCFHNAPYGDISQQAAFHYDSMSAEPDHKYGVWITLTAGLENVN
jgi:hypothetical protein